MYQYTEAFCHYSSNSPEAQNSGLLIFTKKNTRYQENLEDRKIARKKKHGKIWGKSSPIGMTLASKYTALYLVPGTNEDVRRQRFYPL